MSNRWPYSDKRWPELRRRVLRAAEYRCAVCSASIRGKGASRVDHIVPVKQAPALAFELRNLRALCPACDNARHAEKGRGGRERPAIGPDGYPL